MSFVPLCSLCGSNVFIFALSSNGKKSINLILDTDANPDHHKNLIASKLNEE